MNTNKLIQARCIPSDDNIAVINQHFDDCMRMVSDENGRIVGYEPFTCCACDMFVKPANIRVATWKMLEKNSRVFMAQSLNPLHPDLVAYYSYSGPHGIPPTDDESFDLKRLMLSPRSQTSTARRKDTGQKKTAGKSNAKKRKKNLTSTSKPVGLIACKYCYTSIRNGHIPKFAISNGFFFGAPPKELLELNDVELAFISPVKAYGYCFTYTGAKSSSMQLKGTLSFYKIDPNSLVRTVAKFGAFDMSENIVVVLYGKMTKSQKEKARKRSCLRPAKVLAALEWLCHNHETFKTLSIDLDDLRRNMGKPYVVDHSEMKETDQDACLSVAQQRQAVRTNIESVDYFQIFFPDKTINPTQGGYSNKQSFEEYVKAAKLSHLSFHLHTDFQKNYVPDYKDDNLVNACLLQFPYGRGGLNECRADKIGDSFSESIDIIHYIKALSRNSQPQFHLQLFSLILYNLHQKQRMVRGASVVARDTLKAGVIAHQITTQQVRDAVGRVRKGASHSTSPGDLFLGSVDAVAGHVAHSNRNTKRAPRNAESLTHHFGMPSYFLTVSPDDDYNILVQVYSGQLVDRPGTRIENLSDNDLANMHSKRAEVRVKYPGVCAHAFELMMDIVVGKIIGWDNPGRRGMFGECLAFTQTVEEQGRLSLHAHFQIWIKEVNELRDKLFSSTGYIVACAKKELCKHVDRHISTKFISQDLDPMAGTMKCFDIFPHDCTVADFRQRRHPILADDQTLRNLRHKIACKLPGENSFAICPHCLKGWTIEDIIHCYLINAVGVPNLSAWPDDTIHRLKAMCVQHQRDNPPASVMPSWLVEAAYNVHRHSIKSCFKRKFGTLSGLECRFRYPKPKRRRTCIQEVGDDATIKWYSFDGSFSVIASLEVIVQRALWDAFQNQSCPYISHSKFQCNTNIQMLLPGILAAYVFKYTYKATQDEDSAGYDRMINQVSRLVANMSHRQITAFSETICRLLGAAIAHQSSNVVGASMAAYLTRNDSRFQMSHEFVWCPLRDLKSLLEGHKVNYYLSASLGKAQWACTALNYLCRNELLEHECTFDFFTKYRAVPSTKRRKAEEHGPRYYAFENKGYIHPSFDPKSGNFSMILARYNAEDSDQTDASSAVTRKLIKVLQHDFPDTASFNGLITDPDVIINPSMEKYSSFALLLFVPFRCLADLQVDGSYTKKFRQLYGQTFFSRDQLKFLQNIQDAKANSFRYISREDELQRTTVPFSAAGRLIPEELSLALEEDESPVEFAKMCANPETSLLHDRLTSAMHDSLAGSNKDEANPVSPFPTSINLFAFRLKGTNKGGFQCLPTPSTAGLQESVVRYDSTEATEHDLLASVNDLPTDSRNRVTQSDLIHTLLVGQTNRRVVIEVAEREDPDSAEGATTADGSARSIIEWGVAAELDQEQQTAFQIITSHFVLTLYRKAMADSDGYGDRSNRALLLSNYTALCKLTRTNYKRNPQLVGLLHGPGGSGKSKVINLVIQYASSFCNMLPGYNFTDRTILVCAYSGVAATLLRGQTFHSALFLNQKKELSAEQVEAFLDVEMVIIDEISFAGYKDFEKLHLNLETLKQRMNALYGGVDIVFAGDFRQLTPIKALPIYKHKGDLLFKGGINAYMELNGRHRFRNDPEWGEILNAIREGTVTTDQIARINERKVDVGDVLPEDTQIAVHFNKDRDVKNSAIFHQQLLSDISQSGCSFQSILIFAGDVSVKKGGTGTSFEKCTSAFHALYQHVGENDIVYGDRSFRTDPLLKLRIGSRVMVTKNINVSAGIANGTVATVQKVLFQPGEEGFNVNIGGGATVLGVFSDKVRGILLKHTDPTIEPQQFILKPESFTIHPLIPVKHELRTSSGQREQWTVRITHFPLVLTWATTVHKLQGQTVDRLFIHSWKEAADWIYVALSRVATRSGLFLNKYLPFHLPRLQPDEDYKSMITFFRTRRTRPALDDMDIEAILHESS